MTTTALQSQREVPRFRVCNPQDLKATLGVDEVGATPVSIVEFSPVGARLSLESRLMAPAQLTFRVESRKRGLSHSSVAEVRWCTPSADGWQVGVSFVDKPLPEEFLTELTNHKIIERRQSNRLSVAMKGALKRAGDAEETRFDVVDLSSDGICIDSPNSASVGDSLLLTLDTPTKRRHQIVGVTRWVEQHETGYRLGCEIPTSQIQPMLNACGLGTEGPRLPRRDVRHFGMLTWLVAMLCAAATLTMAWLPPDERAAHVTRISDNGRRIYTVTSDWVTETTAEFRKSAAE